MKITPIKNRKEESMIVTSKDIRDALELRYQLPDWELCYEVGNSTGGQKSRALDAIAINTFPSHGFSVHGVEIKVSKQDLKKELEDSGKSEELAKFCDYFFLACPKGLLDETITLPPTWGVLELRGKKLFQTKRPEQLFKKNPTAGFLCAMLRGRDRLHEINKNAYRRKIEAQAEEWALENGEAKFNILKDSHDNLIKKLEEVKEKTGVDLLAWRPNDYVCEEIKVVQNLPELGRNMLYLKNLCDGLKREAEKIEELTSFLREKPGSEEANGESDGAC